MGYRYGLGIFNSYLSESKCDPWLSSKTAQMKYFISRRKVASYRAKAVNAVEN